MYTKIFLEVDILFFVFFFLWFVLLYFYDWNFPSDFNTLSVLLIKPKFNQFSHLWVKMNMDMYMCRCKIIDLKGSTPPFFYLWINNFDNINYLKQSKRELNNIFAEIFQNICNFLFILIPINSFPFDQPSFAKRLSQK